MGKHTKRDKVLITGRSDENSRGLIESELTR